MKYMGIGPMKNKFPFLTTSFIYIQRCKQKTVERIDIGSRYLDKIYFYVFTQ